MPDPAAVAPTPRRPGRSPFLALAPMDGVTCHVYRDVVTRGGFDACGITACVSEFVRVTDRTVPDHVLLRAVPELAAGGTTPSGIPVYVQILGGAPEPMAATARAAVRLGARGVDLNFGCPARTVNRHDGGAAILKTPDRVYGIAAAVRDAVPAPIPVSVKVRLGWDRTDAIAAIAEAAERAGASFLVVHCRTRVQGYRPPAHWSALAPVLPRLSIPVVANGDLFAPGDVAACARTCGARSFMFGRGVMARPTLFLQVRGLRPDRPDPLPELAAWIRTYADALAAAGAPERARLCRVKQWLRMAAAIRPDVSPIFDRVKRLSDLADALGALDALTAPAGERPGRTDRPQGLAPPLPRPRAAGRSGRPAA